MIYIKVIVFFISLLLSGMFLDELIENIIYFSQEKRMTIFPVGLFIVAIVWWAGFYYVTLL